MKLLQNLFKILICTSAFAVVAIIGGVECGASAWNLIWCIPCFAVASISAFLIGAFDD